MRGVRNRDLVAGAILVVVGGFFLARNLVPGVEVLIPLFVGLGLLAVFFIARAPGALVPGSVITGIGIGLLVASQPNQFGGAGFLASVGAGFLLVSILAAVFQLRQARFWPLVPGSLLIAAGALIYAAQLGPQVLDVAEAYWPLVLLVVGGYLLLMARRALVSEPAELERSRAGGDDTPTRPLEDARERGRPMGEHDARPPLGEGDRPPPLDRV